MSKNIIVCTDGTWNHPSQTQADLSREDWKQDETNVCKLFRALPGASTNRSATMRVKRTAEQVALYEDGVGADGIWAVRIAEGAIGAGLETKLRDCYQFVSEEYEDGDRIYLFGFSRGAFTARSVGGMLVRCGIPAKGAPTTDAANHAFDVYRHNNQTLTAQFRQDYHARDVIIEVIGVWDTVGALGIPLLLFSHLDNLLFQFHDTALHPNVRFGYHAVAINEKRESFTPTLWDAREGIEQVWFPGVHSDVGGGYRETGLSDSALAWMLEKVKPHGILFQEGTFTNDGHAAIQGNALLDPMHNSYKPPFLTLHPAVREIPQSATFHKSVHDRWEITKMADRPSNLPPPPWKLDT